MAMPSVEARILRRVPAVAPIARRRAQRAALGLRPFRNSSAGMPNVSHRAAALATTWGSGGAEAAGRVGAASDAIHASHYFWMAGGNVFRTDSGGEFHVLPAGPLRCVPAVGWALRASARNAAKVGAVPIFLFGLVGVGTPGSYCRDAPMERVLG